MATYTPNLNLKKPAGSDYVLVGDFNGNADELDRVIGKPTQLETNERTNLVLAINEAMKRGGENGPYIDSVTETWWMWDPALLQYFDTGYPATGPAAGFDEPTATATGLPPGDEPTVTVTATGPNTAKVFGFAFGIPEGRQGLAAGFGTPEATAETLPTGEDAAVTVSAAGPDTAKVFRFAFGLPRGETGDNAEIVGATAEVDNTIGNPQVDVSMGGTPAARTFHFAFTGLRGVDGQGAVSAVNSVPPDATGNVTLTPEDIGAARPSEAYSLTLTADAWAGGQQTVAVPGLGADDNGNAGLSMTATAAEVNAAMEAILRVTGQEDGAVTITAFGAVPTVDIPILIIKE